MFKIAERKTHEKFLSEVYELVGDEYTILGEYQNTHRKIKIRHNNDKCNSHIYEATPAKFLTGRRCPKCANNTKYTNEEFKKHIYDLVGDEYTVISKYIDAKSKIKLRHNFSECNYNIYDTTPDKFNHGVRCYVCTKRRQTQESIKTHQQFCDDVVNLVGSEYTIIGKYINSKTKIKLKHNVCNTIYEVAPAKFLYGNRCPVCNESKGEQRIRNYLNGNNIKFSKEYEFVDLIGLGGGYLKYDFAIFYKEFSKPLILIEYQGIQHYELIGKWISEQQFNKQKLHDQMKRDYCINNNIKLLEIPYWDFDNVESILEKELNASI